MTAIDIADKKVFIYYNYVISYVILIKRGFLVARPCKICGLDDDKRGFIDGLIISGLGYKEIEERVKAKGINVSHMSIKRHLDNGHVQGHIKSKDDAVGDLGDFIEIPTITDTSDLKEFAEQELLKITANQLLILRTKQEMYMQGKARYPSSEVSGLKNIMQCLAILTGKGDILDLAATKK